MLLAIALLACADAPPAAPVGRAPDDTAPAATDAALPDLTDWIAEVEGAWAGTADPTPLGAMPFALDFAWETDDDLSGTAAGYGLSMTFRYHREGDDWQLIEEGSLPGGLTQSFTLEPAVVEPDRVEWTYPEDPHYLRVVEVHGAQLVLETWVRGALHAVITLERR